MDSIAPRERHERLEQHFEARGLELERLDARYSTLRLLSFLSAGVLVAGGIWGASRSQLGAGLAALVVFFVLVLRHLGVLQKLSAARVRRDVHRRHLMRLSNTWQTLPNASADAYRPDHAYAWDIDLAGAGSLLQRIDVTHTREGAERIARFLGQAAPTEVALARQAAVAELARDVELRQELEATAELAFGDAKLDASGFRTFATLASLFEAQPYLYPLCFALPLLTLGLYLASALGALPPGSWLLGVTLQIGLLTRHGKAIRRAFDLADARKGVVDAFEGMLRCVESARFTSETLRALQAELHVGDAPASEHMRRLTHWVGMAALRQQFLLHVVINPLTLWDLHVLHGLEAWNRRVGRQSERWFAALGELEALCCLATLHALEPESTLAELVDSEQPLVAEGIAHPLLAPGGRVPNDLQLRGPGTALMVTGSNMAGKSTLLRSVGLNVALALAGGPVCARRMRVPRLRLRAAMRAQDSLQQGASYFHAELEKLRGVVVDAESDPPVLFLLDELLRGTNEHARHVGAKAVLLHLLERRATGLVATHDTALAATETERPDRIANVHFTDVVRDGEMVFDYRLRPGIVRTSNALRLLAMAGIDVPADPGTGTEPLASPLPPHEPSVAPER